nr:mechanosensitive ion channel [Succinivibrionaceae bacterium]
GADTPQPADQELEQRRQAAIAQVERLAAQELELADTVARADELRESYRQELGATEWQSTAYQAAEIKEMDAKAIAAAIKDLEKRLHDEQERLNAANQALSDLQTLPSRTQNTITKNTERGNALAARLKELGDRTLPEAQVITLEIQALEAERDYLEHSLAEQSTLQDLSDYRQRIAASKVKALSELLREAQARQRELSFAAMESSNADRQREYESVPELKHEYETNQMFIRELDLCLKKGHTVEQQLNELNQLLATLRQITQATEAQMEELSGSLVLSKLLNRQLGALPSFTLKEDPDDLIPNISLGMYDLQTYRESFFNIDSFVDGLVAQTPSLALYRQQVHELISNRKELMDHLYIEVGKLLGNAANLKVKHEEYLRLSGDLRTKINERLFWLASNQPLGPEMLRTLPFRIAFQFRNFVKGLSAEGIITTSVPSIALLLAMAAISMLIITRRKALRRLDCHLAMRLDKDTDGHLVTPTAIAVSLLTAVGRALPHAIAGALVVILLGGQASGQLSVLLMVILHIIAFKFFLEILSPNALAQRHFAIPPGQLRMQEALLRKIYWTLIPILVLANIREANALSIDQDSIGYLLMLCCTIAMLVIIVRTYVQALRHGEARSLGATLFWLLAIALSAGLLVTLALGYYLTAIKLINRVAFTLYTCIGCVILGDLARREIAVTSARMQRRLIADTLAEDRESLHRRGPAPQRSKAQILSEIDQRVRGQGARVKRLASATLISLGAILVYQQWNDLAGVLNYLDTLNLWESVSLLDGKEIISSRLSLLNVCEALLAIAVMVLLHRNVPQLLERAVTLRRATGGWKSAGYTVRIIASYIITTIGLLVAAGFLGIGWDNLQWLVAALSVGLGFGLQEIFANFVSGIIILFERQIRVGDIITLGDLSGTVQRIRIRSTAVLSFDNKEVMIPNRQFLTSALTNWALTSTTTRVEFEVGISYEADAAAAKSILREIVSECRWLDTTKQSAIFINGLSDSAVTILCEVFVKEIGNRKATFDYLSSRTLQRFAQAGIEIPYNQLDVKIKNLGELAATGQEGEESARQGG